MSNDLFNISLNQGKNFNNYQTKIKQSVGNRTKMVKQNDLVTDVGRLEDLMGSRVSDVAKPYDFISLLIQRVSGTRGRPG